MKSVLLRTIRATAVLIALVSAAALLEAQEPPDEHVVVQVDYITAPLTVPDDVDQLWKYLESATLRGPTPELLALNGLRMGRLETRFRAEFDDYLKKMPITATVPQAVQMLPGRPQDFNIGPEFADRTIFIWKSENSFIGRHFKRAREGMTLTARPTSQRDASISIEPVLRYGVGLNDRMDLRFLAVETKMAVGESIVFSPAAGTPRGLGASFFRGADERARSRSFIIITLTAVRKAE